MKYKAVIYDLDGTILDSRADIVATTKATIEYMNGKMLADSEIYSYVGKGLMDLVRQSLGEIAEDELKRAVDFFNEHYHAHCLDESRLYAGTAELVSELQIQKVKQAIFTNKPQAHTDTIIAGLHCGDWFDYVHGAQNGHDYKPNIKTTEHVLKTIGVSASEALMIGDSHVDFETAKNAGMDCVLLFHGYSTRAEILAFKDEALALCENVHALWDVLKKL